MSNGSFMAEYLMNKETKAVWSATIGFCLGAAGVWILIVFGMPMLQWHPVAMFLDIIAIWIVPIVVSVVFWRRAMRHR